MQNQAPSGVNPHRPRFLVCSAGFGEGHNAAARSLVAAFDRAEGPGAAALMDIFAQATPRTDAAVRSGYLYLINRAPLLWSWIYRWTDRAQILPRYLWLLRDATKALARAMEAGRPAAVCCTYPTYAFMFEHLAARGLRLPPWYNVVTDSISINSLWWKAPCAGWFLPNEDSAEVLRRAGIPAERIHVAGFPVAPFFADHERELVRPDLAAGAAPRVLYIVNSGVQGAEATARALLAEEDWEVTITVGRNARLRAELESAAAGRRRPAAVYGWTDQIPRLLLTHHVVLSKAGGATTQEAIAARCPMIVNQVVPGQEEGNYELLRRHGAGAFARGPAQVLAVLRGAFADRGAGWRRWREALEPLARPEAARAIAAHVLAAARVTESDATLRAP